MLREDNQELMKTREFDTVIIITALIGMSSF